MASNEAETLNTSSSLEIFSNDQHNFLTHPPLMEVPDFSRFATKDTTRNRLGFMKIDFYRLKQTLGASHLMNLNLRINCYMLFHIGTLNFLVSSST